MKTISPILASLSILLPAMPLTAQTRPGQLAAHQPRGVRQSLNDLRAQLNAGIAHGTITQREAMMLRVDLRALKRMGRTYGRDGFSRAERASLMLRGDDLRHRIQRAIDNDGRGAPPTG